jgi:Ca2+-binding EF-hand superfamily protein
MKRYPTQNILRWGIPILCFCGLQGSSIVTNAQEPQLVNVRGYGAGMIVTGGVATAVAPNGAVAGVMWRTGPGGSNAGFALQIGGNLFGDTGPALLKACDLNNDGNVTLPELKAVASVCFKLWDTNNAGALDQTALLNGMKDLLPMPQPPAGLTPPPDEFTPPGQLAKHIFAAADSNKDGVITLRELNDFFDKNFSQWDQDNNGSLNAQELSLAFAQLAAPDPQGFRTFKSSIQQ